MPVPSRRLVLALAAFASLPALLTGCTTAVHAEARLEAPAIDEASVAGPAIDISNLRGNITVRVDRLAKGVSVDSRVRLDKNAQHFDLDIINSSIEVTSEFQDRGGLPALVVTTTSRREEQDYFVDLDIRLPAAEGVRIRSLGGEIRVSGVGGAIDIDNGSGPVEVRSPVALTQPVTVRTGSGNVYLQAPPDTTARLSLRTASGKTVLEARESDTVLQNTVSRMTELTSTINRGQNAVTLTTGEGDVRMLLLESPMGRVRTSLRSH